MGRERAAAKHGRCDDHAGQGRGLGLHEAASWNQDRQVQLGALKPALSVSGDLGKVCVLALEDGEKACHCSGV